MITEAQLEILHSYRTQFLETGEIHENVRPLIAKSWQRSTAYGVDPESRASISKYGFLTDNEVKALRAENRHLIKVAQPIMAANRRLY